MSKNIKIRAAVIGASGYTGADVIRLAALHPDVTIKALIAKTHAGKSVAGVFPHLGTFELPDMITANDVNWKEVDVAFCGLPHGASHEIISSLPEHVKIIDMSADFRLRRAEVYTRWYGQEHKATHLLPGAVYGLSEHYSQEIANARLVACPGCYPTATLMALLPVIRASQIEPHDIIIDAKSGISGAGRSLKLGTMFTEAGEGLSPYAIAAHRHAPEIEQELSSACGEDVIVNFTPHLVPMSRGELITAYVRLINGAGPDDLRQNLQEFYADKPFVQVLEPGIMPATQHVRGSNYCLVSVFEDRIKDRAIIVAAIDNLVKGSAGQALQNFNIMHGLAETTGLQQLPLFP